MFLHVAAFVPVHAMLHGPLLGHRMSARYPTFCAVDALTSTDSEVAFAARNFICWQAYWPDTQRTVHGPVRQ